LGANREPIVGGKGSYQSFEVLAFGQRQRHGGPDSRAGRISF
jgi:hypothetical protein